MRRFVDKMALVFLGAAVFAAGSLHAGLITKVNTFSSGQVITHTAMNTNFDDLYTLVNGNLNDANISTLSADQISGTAMTLSGAQTITGTKTFTGEVKIDGTFRGITATFADADVTPSVNGGALVFTTGNTSGATNLDELDDCVAGQLVIIIAGDANTTIRHAAGSECDFRTGNASSKTMALGEIHMFIGVDDGSLDMHEITRSVP